MGPAGTRSFTSSLCSWGLLCRLGRFEFCWRHLPQGKAPPIRREWARRMVLSGLRGRGVVLGTDPALHLEGRTERALALDKLEVVALVVRERAMHAAVTHAALKLGQREHLVPLEVVPLRLAGHHDSRHAARIVVGVAVGFDRLPAVEA